MPKTAALAALAVLVGFAAPAEARHFRLPRASQQLVVVIADAWSSTAGTLQRFERGDKGPWKPVGDPISVELGKSGLGWGLGIQPEETSVDRAGPLKEEGDGRSPAGVFHLTRATGYAPAPPAGTTLAYTQATPRLVCVSDRKSKSYNQLVELAAGAALAPTDERMKRADDLYALTILVEHNTRPVVPGQGSCVFLHIGNGQPTTGCTAMPRPALETLLTWLDAKKDPLLIQLPSKDYAVLAHAWRLPKLPSH